MKIEQATRNFIAEINQHLAVHPMADKRGFDHFKIQRMYAQIIEMADERLNYMINNPDRYDGGVYCGIGDWGAEIMEVLDKHYMHAPDASYDVHTSLPDFIDTQLTPKPEILKRI